MYHHYPLWTLLLFSAFNSDAVFAELQLQDGTDVTFSGSDSLGDWYLDSENPGGVFLDDITAPNSFELASLLPTTSSVDAVEPLFPQDDLFATDIAAADCPSAGFESKNKFRRRQACMQRPQDHPEVNSPTKDPGSNDRSLPEGLGLFEPYDPFAYGEKDEDSCPPGRFGDKQYSVCDSGTRNMFSIDQFGYASLQYCKPAYKYLSCLDPSWKWCCEGAREVGTALCRAFGCVPADPNHQWLDRLDDNNNVPL